MSKGNGLPCDKEVTIETKKIKDFYDRIYKEMNKFIEDTL